MNCRSIIFDVHVDFSNSQQPNVKIDLDVSTWHHIVITAKDGDQRIYIDGVIMSANLEQTTINDNTMTSE